MARSIYGADGSAQVVSVTGVPTTAAATVKSARVGGVTITDVQNMAGAGLGGIVTPDTRGQVIFQGPNGSTATYWLDFGDGGPRWAVKPVDIPALITTLSGRVDLLEGTSGRIWEVVVNGYTDAAVATAVNTVLLPASLIGAAVQRRLVFKPGVYNLTAPIIADNASLPAQIENLVIEGAGMSTVLINWNNGTQPLIKASLNRIRWFTMQGMTITSQNSLNVFCYAFSQTTGGFNQGWVFKDIHFTGSWTRGIGLDGGTAGNLNSELTLEHVFTAASSVWSDAFFVCGLTDNSTENQFLNYWIIDCCLSLSSGTLFKFKRGGSITAMNGSWSANSTSNTITWFDMSQNAQSNSPDRNQMLVMRQRFEPKGSAHKILTCKWADGAIKFLSCSDNGSSQNTGSYVHERYTITGNAIWSNQVAISLIFDACSLGGICNYSGGVQTRGGVVVDNCKIYRGDLGERAYTNKDEAGATVGATAANPWLQWSSTNKPKLDFKHGWNYQDALSWAQPT